MTEITSLPATPALAAAGKAKLEGRDDAALLQKAKEFEAAFVAQMLSYGGFTKALNANSGFGGEAFSSLLVEQYSERLVERGGFGLADKIYEQLRDREAQNVNKTVA